MPVSKPADLPQGGGGRWPHTGEGFRSARWGDHIERLASGAAGSA
ncbi:MAG TPA: hypothetical protein VFI47_00745 [Acidimicrobiales bacterium]|nr:hypothetical protein [Acidimicrobiales bacterium]